MLYSPKWEKKVATEPFTLPHLIAWLEMQPADRQYNYDCGKGECLLDRYIQSVTGRRSEPSVLHWQICGGDDQYWAIAQKHPRTFGAALDRARASLASME